VVTPLFEHQQKALWWLCEHEKKQTAAEALFGQPEKMRAAGDAGVHGVRFVLVRVSPLILLRTAVGPNHLTMSSVSPIQVPHRGASRQRQGLAKRLYQ
jgi:hypothetical protein